MIIWLKHWWKNFQYWRWPRIRETTEPQITRLKRCPCSSCAKDEEHFVRDTSQGLREAEVDPVRETFPGINTEDIVDKDRVSVMVSIMIPPSSDDPLYDHYAYEFEKSMGMLVAKCLDLSEKFKRDDLSVGAFTITADLFLRDEEADVIFENGRPEWLKECLKTGESE